LQKLGRGSLRHSRCPGHSWQFTSIEQPALKKKREEKKKETKEKGKKGKVADRAGGRRRGKEKELGKVAGSIWNF